MFCKPTTLRSCVSAIAATLTLGFSAVSVAETELPDTMTWSAYDVGSAGYAEASAIADAFGKKYGTRIRIQPSGSAIGRLQPLLNKRADFSFLATESFFASEGLYDFATRRWGPQDLRVLLGRPAAFGVFTAADANIKTLKDLKGKRFAYVAGNDSINVKCDAFLAYAGLTRDDVEAIMFPTYASTMSSLTRNEADATCSTTTPSHLYELAESPRGIHWLNVSKDDVEGMKRLHKSAPFFQPFTETVGAGLSAENSIDILAYRYPMVITRANLSDDEVYVFVKAMDETYDMYKDATSVMPRWRIEESGTPVADVPFHAGAVRYLKEKGIWTDEHEAWNQERTERLNALLAAWPKAIAEGEGKDDEAFAVIWEKHRMQALNAL